MAYLGMDKAEMRKLYEQFAHEDVSMAEEGLGEYVEELRRLDLEGA